MPRANKKKQLNRAEKKEVRDIARKAIKNMAEIHFHASDYYNTVSTSGYVQDLSIITQTSTGDQNRIGDSITLTSMEVRYDWEVADTTNRVRLILFRWNDDGAPGVNDILLNTVSVPRCYASYNKDSRSKFNILYDKVMVVGQGSGTDNVKYREFKRKLTGKINYSSGGTSGVKHVYLMAISDSLTGNPTLAFYSRLNYLP